MGDVRPRRAASIPCCSGMPRSPAARLQFVYVCATLTALTGPEVILRPGVVRDAAIPATLCVFSLIGDTC
jgi:hypothetical protein